MFGQFMSNDKSYRVGTVQIITSTKLSSYLLTYQIMHTAGFNLVVVLRNTITGCLTNQLNAAESFLRS